MITYSLHLLNLFNYSLNVLIAGNAFDQIDNPASSSSKPLSKEEILRRYIDVSVFYLGHKSTMLVMVQMEKIFSQRLYLEVH